VTGRVDARRPAIYLAVAAVLAAGALLLPDGTSAASPPIGPPPGSDPAAVAPAPACTETRESLRPAGPLPAPGAMPAGSTMAAIAERGRLIVGVDQGKFRMGYRNPATGELEGSDIDIARRIAAAIFGDPGRVQFVVLNIADRVAAIRDQRVDVVVNSFAVTCERQRSVEFSTAYMAVSQRMLVPAGSGIREVEDLAGQRVCTSRGSTTENVLRGLPAGLDVVTLPGIPDCVVELQQGRVAAVSSDDVLLAGLAAQDPQTEIIGRSLGDTSYAVGLNPGAPDLVRFVNAVLERGRADGSLAASNEAWFGQYLDPVPRPAAARYRD
jgi:polar amino acid transport system substrate-binding protein